MECTAACHYVPIASLARELAVKGCDANAESLERGQGPAIVHGEAVAGNTTELQHVAVLLVSFRNQLEVLHRRLSDSAIKVQAICAKVGVPLGNLVNKLDDVLVAHLLQAAHAHTLLSARQCQQTKAHRRQSMQIKSASQESEACGSKAVVIEGAVNPNPQGPTKLIRTAQRTV
jgi:hypothetical protein